ncbi:tetratricopeptide repeat protein [Hwanghaeella grinnelliae]|uniref:Tetratricopeptide repeat protein n=1 Tax=Hwanghaeella grinnelliae TaxID=2500179 RepID=A0A3S2VP49_9PROT|nr:tetratricopeptide repeat protein [Hwanghaeella grinnelliae]RVU35197.1 tetratricopeptide repeat protein [Hwanghaeella grinnelliae]
MRTRLGRRLRWHLKVGTVMACLALPGCMLTGEQAKLAGSAPSTATFEAVMNAGEEKMQEGDFAAAASLFRNAHSVNLEAPEPLTKLGMALSLGGAPEEATEAFRAALNRAPKDVEARRGLANALLSIGEPALAIPHYLAAVEAAPTDYRAYLGLGAAYDMTGDHLAAQSTYRAGLAQGGDSLDLQHNLGLSEFLAGSEEAGIARLRTVVGSTGASPQHRQTLVMVLALAGQEDEAREIASFDMDPASVERNLEYFRTIRGLQDPKRRLDSIRAFMANGRPPQS